jgi:uncharacterized protein (TIGR02246 family)
MTKIMTKTELIALVERYFQAVDTENFTEIASILSPDCIFTVESHGVKLRGRAEIETMFTRLWQNHANVRHENFSHVAAAEEGRIASQFNVINTEHDGSLTHKSNCNFFHVDGDRFSHVAVYMAGGNTLDTS